MTVASHLARFFRRVTRPMEASRPLPAPERWEDQWPANGLQAADWLRGRRAHGRLYVDLPDDRLERLRERVPARVVKTVAAAERVMRHEFNLLGSGPYVPIDSNRPAQGTYVPIDWAIDPVAGLRFPTGFRHADWTPAMRPGLADIKLPWELGRCQHWVVLGQAFRLTGDDRYADEIIGEHQDFIDANPIGMGVQYICTMDAAIRAVNWALAFELIRASAALGRAGVTERVYQSLFDLGVFIERNLENKYEVTSNHFLSNVIGLFTLGVLFAELPAGRRWAADGRAWLEQEMTVQVLADGADYESSIPYHRLVTECFVSGARLAELEGAPLSSDYRAQLCRMIQFLTAVIRPDGLLPQVGDADDGRLHIFTDYGEWNPQDGRHLLAPAACVLGEPQWSTLAGDVGIWEASWWGFDADSPGVVTATDHASSIVRLFNEAGIATVRSGDTYLIVTNGRVGTHGFGNHKHNDLLGFEFFAGEPLLVDPGSYVYTSNPDARNLFRSTSYHNTVSVDGVEQNDLKSEYLFRLFETSTVEHLRFEDTADYTEYAGSHTGYLRLPSPVLHVRALRLLKGRRALLITDRFHGSGRHQLKWHFHAAPGVRVDRSAAGEFNLATATRRWRLVCDPAFVATIADAWYSPSYGVRLPCHAIDLSLTSEVTDNRYQFVIEPAVT